MPGVSDTRRKHPGSEELMQILYYSWNENSSADIIQTFEELGHGVTCLQFPIRNYLVDEAFAQALLGQLALHSFDMIFTFNYFPVISSVAQQSGLNYISWVYDCPHLTLYSPTLANSCNYLFLFDRDMAAAVRRNGAVHAFHLPLAANTTRINRTLGLSHELSDAGSAPDSYLHEVTFLGSLYEQNFYDQIHFLPEKLRGYLDGIMASQKQLWGVDLMTELVDEPLAAELSKYVSFEENPLFPCPQRTIFTHMLQSKITSDERITALNLLANTFPVALYSASSRELCPNAVYHGYISYIDRMPEVFRRSKINLNITLRSITSGIPLRAIDILSCGGFLFSNYQPELAEYFEAGTDFIYFEDFDDMMKKTDYFLSHERERQEIAHCGYKKVQENFSYCRQVDKMLQYVTSDKAK